MPLPSPHAAPVTCRQRLTGLGWVGVLLALDAPVVPGFVPGFVLVDHADGLGNRYSAPRFPAGEILVLLLASVAGWIMILVGREYFPFQPLTSPSAAEPPAAREAYLDGK